MNKLFLSLALLVLPALAMDGRPAAGNWRTTAVALWRAHTPLITGVAAGTAIALGGNQVPGALAELYAGLPQAGQAAVITAGTVAAAGFNQNVLDGKFGTLPTARDTAALYGTAIATAAVVSYVAARFARNS